MNSCRFKQNSELYGYKTNEVLNKSAGMDIMTLVFVTKKKTAKMQM